MTGKDGDALTTEQRNFHRAHRAAYIRVHADPDPEAIAVHADALRGAWASCAAACRTLEQLLAAVPVPADGRRDPAIVDLDEALQLLAMGGARLDRVLLGLGK